MIIAAVPSSSLLVFPLQGMAGMRAQSSRGASFLQQLGQDGKDEAVKVSVAGVAQPGKSISKRIGRLAEKWFALSSASRLQLLLLCDSGRAWIHIMRLRACACRRASATCCRRGSSSDRLFASASRGLDQVAGGRRADR